MSDGSSEQADGNDIDISSDEDIDLILDGNM